MDLSEVITANITPETGVVKRISESRGKGDEFAAGYRK
jgi:hypothetical protein